MKMSIPNLVAKEEWQAVRNHTAFRAEKKLGHIAWGWGEDDVYIMRDCCTLEADSKTKPKLSPCSVIKQCSYNDCDAYLMSDVFTVRHLLLKHLHWPTECGHCRQAMNDSISTHQCMMKCSLCPGTFPDKRFLAAHYFIHHKKFFCELCEQTMESLSEMKEHIAAENCVLARTCIFCRKRFPEEKGDGAAMKNHLMLCHVNVTEMSDSVPQPVATANDPKLITKISMRYKPLKTETYQFDNFQCPHCQRLFSARSGLKIHVGIAHRGEFIVFCPRCPKTFCSVTECKAHLKSVHNRKGTADKSAISKDPVILPKVTKSAVPSNISVDGTEASEPEDTSVIEIKSEKSDESDLDEIMECNDLEVMTDSPKIEPAESERGQDSFISSLAEDVFVEENIKKELEFEDGPITDPIAIEKEVEAETVKKKKAKKPLPALLKISDGSAEPDSVTTTSPIVRVQDQSSSASPSLVPQSPASFVVTSDHMYAEKSNGVKRQKLSEKLKVLKRKLDGSYRDGPIPILPKPDTSISVKPTSQLVNNSLLRSPEVENQTKVVAKSVSAGGNPKVFIPVVGVDGKTILMELDKAQEQMKGGAITFLPSGSSETKEVQTPMKNVVCSSNKIISITREGSSMKVVLSKPGTTPTTTSVASSNPSIPVTTSKEYAPFSQDPGPGVRIESVSGSSSIMRNKVALNLPVVLTKRSNKKLAQDNPFFEISVVNQALFGSCRVCKMFSAPFSEKEAMVVHFETNHKQKIEIKRFPLYYEISFRMTSRSRKKYFLCFYCGKEFTTKFNVRRHQMLYCPRKGEIDLKLLGLGTHDPRVAAGAGKQDILEDDSSLDDISVLESEDVDPLAD